MEKQTRHHDRNGSSSGATVSWVVIACFFCHVCTCLGCIRIVASTPPGSVAVHYHTLFLVDLSQRIAPCWFAIACCGVCVCTCIQYLLASALYIKPRRLLQHAVTVARQRIVSSKSRLQSAQSAIQLDLNRSAMAFLVTWVAIGLQQRVKQTKRCACACTHAGYSKLYQHLQ
jgi:hypothetical protein